MADILFQQVAMPNFANVNALAAQAAQHYQNAFRTLQETAKNAQTAVRDNNTAKLMDYLNTAQTADQFNNHYFQQGLQQLRDGLKGEYNTKEYQQKVEVLPDRLNQRALQAVQLQQAQDALADVGLKNQIAQLLSAGKYEDARKLMGQARTDISQYVTLEDQLRNSVLNRQNINHNMTMDLKRFGLEQNRFGLEQQRFGLEKDKFQWQKDEAAEQKAFLDRQIAALGGGSYTPSSSGGVIPPDVRAGILKGESGGDYDALLGYSNRGKGRFSNVKLTDMTVDQAIQFSAPGGEYANWSKDQVGRVATPMGAYQITGSTLRDMKQRLGLKGNEKMTPELQDRIADEIYKVQGTKAWVGYKGPVSAGGSQNAPTYQGISFKNAGQSTAKTIDNSFMGMMSLAGNDPKTFKIMSDLKLGTDKIAAGVTKEQYEQIYKNHPIIKNLGSFSGNLNDWAEDKDSRIANKVVAAINANPDARGMDETYKVAMAEAMLQQAQAAYDRDWTWFGGWDSEEYGSRAAAMLKSLQQVQDNRQNVDAQVLNSDYQAQLYQLQMLQEQERQKQLEQLLMKRAGL